MQLCQNFCSKVQSEGKGPKADISQQYDLHNIDCLLIWYILSILWTHSKSMGPIFSRFIS